MNWLDKARLILADDHRIVREGLKLILGSLSDVEIIDEASNGDELLIKAIEGKPDLIISDLKMPGVSILESAKSLKYANTSTKIIVLTAYDDSEDIYKAIDAGIDGYIMKDTVPQEIISTVEMVLKGYSLYQPKLNRESSESKNDQEFNFTHREREIFQLIVDNFSNKEIAEKLFITEATVKTHVSSILRKTGQPNRSQAVLYAIKNGVLKVSVH